TVAVQPAAPATAAVQPAAPATVAVQPAAPATVAVQPAAPATVAVQPAAPATVAVQPAAPATVAVQPAAPATVAVQPAAPATVAVQPAAPATVAVQPAAPATMAVQPAAPATVAVQPAAPATVAVQPAAPAVVAATPKPSGPIDCLYQLPQAPVSENELSLWAQYAALKSFEYSFDKLDDQLQKLKYCFTDQGWTGFHDALQQSGNLSVIKSQQLTVSSQISGDPVINKVKENQWSISLPLSVVYQNTQEKFTQSLSVTLVVTKKTPTELGIVQLIATVKPETVSAS
nr:DotI/IcmL/TraM family protein [Legionellaceae bacterium]